MRVLARFKRLFPTLDATVFACVAVGLATVIQIAIWDVYGIVFPWVTYCFAVFSAAWYGGLRPALLALALGYLTITLLFASPGTLGIDGKDTLTAFSVYMAYGLFAAFTTESLHRARRRAELAAHEAQSQSERLRQREDALRMSEQRFRMALSSGAVTVFEQDLDLRYAWVFPQDPDFPEGCIGCADRELLPDADARVLTRLKERVIRTGRGARQTVRATLPGCVRFYDLVVEARRDGNGKITGVIGAALDITARKQVEDALKHADRQKNDFLAMLAHEFRNPLTAIRYANQAARYDAAQSDQTAEIIDLQVGHLTRLIDELRDVTRIIQGKIQLEKTDLDMAVILHRAVATVRPLVEAHRHELSRVISPAPMPVRGDAMRLEQILVNLLNNAVKYTPDGGKIHLSALPIGGEVVLCVRDNGVGIPPDTLPQIFELFWQGERSLGRSEGGIGIGLTITRRLIEMHGGTIKALSDGVGRGSEFTVRLPMAKPSAAPAQGGLCGPGAGLEPPGAAVPHDGSEHVHYRDALV